MDCFHDFCLYCDKQCGDAAYCSQSCRLADLEAGSRSNPPSPAASSSNAWSQSLLDQMASQALQVASNKPTTPSWASSKKPSMQPSLERLLKESESLSRCTGSVSRMSLTSSNSTGNVMTEQARLELEEYFSSFDQIRAAKRRSSVR